MTNFILFTTTLAFVFFIYIAFIHSHKTLVHGNDSTYNLYKFNIYVQAHYYQEINRKLNYCFQDAKEVRIHKIYEDPKGVRKVVYKVVMPKFYLLKKLLNK